MFDYRDYPNTNEDMFVSNGNADTVAVLGRDANYITGQWPELKVLLSRKRRRCPFETYTSLMAETLESLANIMLLVRLVFTMTFSPSTAA